jgi:hypothetical protein
MNLVELLLFAAACALLEGNVPPVGRTWTVAYEVALEGWRRTL